MTREEIRAALNPLQTLVCTVFGEAAGEPIEGQVAVGCVIRNRAQHPRWWGKDIKDVCLKHVVQNGVVVGQFSCWWERNRNTDRVYALAEALATNKKTTANKTILGQVQWIAAGILDDLIADNTKGADHYITEALYASTKRPAWTKDRPPVAYRGNHAFFRLEL